MMLGPNDMHRAFEAHDERVRAALRQYELRQRLDMTQPTSAHRQLIARLGDALVDVGSRLQAADAHRPSAPRLDTLGNT